MAQLFCGNPFDWIGEIKPLRDHTGQFVEYNPQHRYHDATGSKLHRHGAGPFCRFAVARRIRRGGVYLILAEQSVMYAGQTGNLETRFEQYGRISPANCYAGNPAQTCRINTSILHLAKSGSGLSVWFYEIDLDPDRRLSCEEELKSNFRPPWNLN